MTSTRTHPTNAGSTEIRWGGSSVRTRTYTDVSPEILMESMVRTEAYARARRHAPRLDPMPSRFRKRLANGGG